MSWFKVDDGFYSHEKVLTIPRAVRAEAVGTWTLCGTWSADKDRDGYVPTHMLEEIGGTTVGAEALVAAKLWRRRAGGYLFINWAQFQPTREQKAEKRLAETKRKAEYRARKAAEMSHDVPDVSQKNSDSSIPEIAVSQSDWAETGGVPSIGAGLSQRDRSGQTRDDAPPVPDPYPTPLEIPTESLSSEVAVATPRPEIDNLLDILDGEIMRNGGKAPKRTKKNTDAVRLMLDRDGYTVDQIERAIRWCQADEFWRSNILSASKLREKYEQLRLAATRTTHGHAAPDEKFNDTLERGRRLAAIHGQGEIAS